jgi:two-component system, cell cycle sensor histidine kinase and response regulator CckA
VVKQILSFSRPSKEGFRPTDLTVVCQEVLSLMDASLPSNISIHSTMPDSIILVDADPTQIHQVILNLCTNAYHALKENGGNIHVHVEETEVNAELAASMNINTGAYLKISVSDNGFGIQPEIIDNIFDPFFSTKDITEGTGLGLSVVHGIVKSHQGGVRVESHLAEGAQFEIYLPKSEDKSTETKEEQEALNSHQMSILFVEDDEDQLDSVSRVLTSLGHSVKAVNDPLEALKMVEEQGESFDLVISDYDMPTMRGTRLADRLAHLPFLIVSGRDDAISASMPYKNICKVLIKPYDKNDLQWALNLVVLQEQ